MTQATRFERLSMFRARLETEIEIAAQAHQVWDAITDFAGYRVWNPCIPEARGAPIAGSFLDVTIHWPGLKPGPYRLEVLGAVVGQELRWLGHFMTKGLLDGDHRFVITAAQDGRTRVRQEESFSGLLVPVFSPWIRNNVLPGFVQVNEALKAYLEQAG